MGCPALFLLANLITQVCCYNGAVKVVFGAQKVMGFQMAEFHIPAANQAAVDGKEILYAGIFKDGTILVLPFAEEIDKWQAVTSLVWVGLPEDPVPGDNVLGGAVCRAIPIEDGFHRHRG